jgi:hypothetical protein
MPVPERCEKRWVRISDLLSVAGWIGFLGRSVVGSDERHAYSDTVGTQPRGTPLWRKRCTIGDGVLQSSMTHTIQSEHESAITGHRFFVLFVFLLATLILFPYAEASHFGSYAFRVIGSFAIVVSVYAAKVHRSLLIFAMVLAIPALIERIVLPKVNAHSFSIFNTVLTLVFDVLFSATCSPRNNRHRKPSLEPCAFICWWASRLPASTDC